MTAFILRADRFLGECRLKDDLSHYFIFLNYFLHFIEVQLIYNVLISAVQQSDSVIHMYIFFSYSFPLWFITGY